MGRVPGKRPQSDNEAASSAAPDTERQPSWDDEGWDEYLYVVDIDYRAEWDLAHGVPREWVQEMLDEYWQAQEEQE